jgi:alkylation response protein AidB-like acyl-CoA dehydrogenase
MDFAFSEEQDLLRASTRRFLERGQPMSVLRSRLEEPETFDPTEWRQAAALGWTSMLIPPEYDGGNVTGQPIVDAIVLGEELGRSLHPGPFVPTNVVADAVATWGSESQRRQFLAPMARGDSVAAWCLSEDGSVDPGSCGVHASGDGGSTVLNGVARFVHGAAMADELLVSALSGGELIHFLVPSSGSGVRIRAQKSLDLTRRFAEISFDGVPVEGSRRLEADPGAVLARGINLATVLQASEAVGAADRVFAETVAYLKDRAQFGRTIASFQAIKHRVANLLVTLEAMRAAAHYAALALSDGFEDADAAVSTAGSYVGEQFIFLCGESLQLHGGIGFTWEHDVHLFLRRAMTSKELYGDPTWHRERLCALAEVA